MNRLDALRSRRNRLVLAAAAQRDAVARDFRALERPLALADRGLAVVRYLRAHRGFALAGVAIVVALRPRRALGLAARAFAAWRTYRLAVAGARRLVG
ncbi:MAG: hypothetical protein IT515_10995 [Burkholderiales bacterium]|nr:hypothetical protein [Burkholderiales bacterium]